MRMWIIKGGPEELFWDATNSRWGGYLQATSFTDEHKEATTLPDGAYWELDWEEESSPVAHSFTWNHRVVKTQEGNNPEDPTLLRLVEVSYDANGAPLGYNDCFMCGDNIDELNALVAHLTEALNQPIIDAGEFPVPAEFEDEEADEAARLEVERQLR